jgi:hypothetical protein
MQFQWLEKWAEDGLLSQEAKTRIYSDCYKIIKSAHTKTAADWQAFKTQMQDTPIQAPLKAEALARGLLDTENFSKKASGVRRSQSREKIAQKVGEDAAVHWTLLTMAITPEGSQKTAAPNLSNATFGELAKNVLLMSSIPLIAGVGMGGIKELLARREHAQMQKRLEGSYAKAMSDAKHDERSVLHENPAAAREAFTALSNFAPHIAAEPMAAKAFMARIVAYNQGIQLDDLQKMTGVENAMSNMSARPSGFSAGFGQGSAAMGLGPNAATAVRSTFQPFVEASQARIKGGK